MSSCADLWGFDEPTGTADASANDASVDTGRVGTDGESGDAVDARSDARDARSSEDVHVDVHVANEAHVDSAPSPTCMPACQFGSTCASVVGGMDVCVTTQSCTDGSDCPFSGCCVWTESSSGTGRCSGSIGEPSTASCLCTKKGTGKEMATCPKCAAPANDPSATVTVCQSG